MDDLKKLTLKIMQENRRQFGDYQYTVPSPDSYPYQWLWDSCFHAIILSYFNPTDAKKELLSLVSKQFANGMIPHMIYWVRKDVINIDWGTKRTSSLTQPPMLAYAVWEIFLKDKDEKFLAEIYPHLYHFYRYFLTDRDPHGNHLMGIINPDESGEDNSSRFDKPLKLPAKHTIEKNFAERKKLFKKNTKCNFDAPFCMRNFFWVKDVPFNAIMVENLFYLANIASKLGFKDDAKYFSEQKMLIKEAMREQMFEKGIYYSVWGTESKKEGFKYKKIKTLTWAIFAPLFAKLYTKAEANELVKNYLLNPEKFKLEYLVPTVAKSDPSFDPNGFWRGPVWIATNWFIYKGLINYGFEKEAEMIKEASIKLLERSGFREQYNPLTGEGEGARDFTWGGLVIDMN